jgi:hypothetical protein
MTVRDCSVTDSKFTKKESTMASSRDGSYTGSISDEELLARYDTKDTEEEVHEVEERQSARKLSRSQSPC